MELTLIITQALDSLRIVLIQLLTITVVSVISKERALDIKTMVYDAMYMRARVGRSVEIESNLSGCCRPSVLGVQRDDGWA